MSDPDTEQAWAHAARAGSADAFAHLVAAHSQALRAFLRRLARDDADDIAQDAFVLAWERIGEFDPARPFRPWLFGIAWRKWRDNRRGWRRLLARHAAYVETHAALHATDPGLSLDLAAAMATLPAEPRAVLLLCLGLDFTHAEAAQALSLPPGTVKSHIARGRQKLAAFLGEQA